MCIICTGYYDESLTKLYCKSCKKIKEIPILPNLQSLNCFDTEIKEIPILPNLQKLYCSYGNFYNNTEIKIFYAKQIIKSKLLNLHRLNKKWKILWKIAEYYIINKYNPDNLTEDYILTNF